MNSGFELVLSPDELPVRAVALGASPVCIGRSPQSEVAVADERVSWQHARVWVQDGVVRVADLGSRNGTWVNERRVVGNTAAAVGDTIRIGERVRLLIRAARPAPAVQHFVIEEVETGLRYPMRGTRFSIGPDPSADLRVESASIHVVRTDGGFRVDGLPGTLDAGGEFRVGELALRVRAVSTVPRSTVGDGSGSLFPYEVGCWLSRALVEIRAPGGQIVARLVGETQTTLMWVLAAALVEDAGLPEADRGWREEHHVMVRVWGRAGLGAAPNRLKVLIHRVRTVLRAAAIDPELLGRKEGRLRLRAARATVSD